MSIDPVMDHMGNWWAARMSSPAPITSLILNSSDAEERAEERAGL